MAWSNIDNAALGKFLQIMFTQGVRNQISTSFRDWENIARFKKGQQSPRSQRFFIKTGNGPAAVSWVSVASPGAYPNASQMSVSEKEAVFKEAAATIEIEYNLWNRARKTPEKYAEPLAEEMKSKELATKRRLSIDLHGDGTGVLGAVSAAGVSVSGSNLLLPLNSADYLAIGTSGLRVVGHVGWFELDDVVVFTTQAGGARAAASGAGNDVTHFRVLSKNFLTGVVTLEGYKTLAAALVRSGAATVVGAGTIVATDLVYRVGQPTKADLTAVVVGTTEMGTLTEVMPGFESLCAADGRLTHGISASGSTAGTEFGCSNNPIDTSYFQRALSLVKTIVGAGTYKWSQALMAPATYDALIESREVDRRFMSAEDGKRGTKKLVYLHEGDQVDMVVSEFAHNKRIRIIPESSSDQGKVLELWGTDFEAVRPGAAGSEFFLRPTGTAAGHDRFIRSYLEAVLCLINKHPASCLTIRDFTNA